MAFYFQAIVFYCFHFSQMVANLYRKYHFKWLNHLISLVNQVTKIQYSLFVKGRHLPKNALLFYVFVRLPNKGRNML